MDLSYGEEYEAYRAEVRAFLEGWPLQGDEGKLPAEEQERIFRARGIEAGFVYRNVPKEFGGAGQAPDAIKDAIVREEFYAKEAPGDLASQGAGLLAPTLLDITFFAPLLPQILWRPDKHADISEIADFWRVQDQRSVY